MKKKTLGQFEQTHGTGKIKELQQRLGVEQAKVAAMADIQGKVTVERSPSSTLRFAVLGDRHVGSLYAHGKALRAFYEYACGQGVTAFFDAGDILDGHRIYKGQEFELRDLGFDAQLARFEKDAPKVKAKTYFIVGNHDLSFKNLVGVSVGRSIAERRKDYVFLGEEQARYAWDTPNGKYEMMLLHPGGGTAYAISYSVQKIVESLEGGSKPNILVVGHYHKSLLLPSYRNICVLQPGTFQKQTPFMARKGLAAHVGGWIIDVAVGKTYNVIKGEFVAFYM